MKYKYLVRELYIDQKYTNKRVSMVIPFIYTVVLNEQYYYTN